MYRLVELRRLAKAYIGGTRIAETHLSILISGKSNNRMIGRLLDGHGIGGRSVEAASDFFDQHWPANVPWPADIARNGAVKEAAE